MRISTDRILTTHAGSLPRPLALLAPMAARRTGQNYDEREYDNNLREAVRDVVRQQVETGIDIVDDGEYSKFGFRAYADERLSGYRTVRVPASSAWAESRESLSFPDFYAREMQPTRGGMTELMICSGPVRYSGLKLLQRDLVNLRTAVGETMADEAFVPAIAPLDIGGAQQNEYFGTRTNS